MRSDEHLHDIMVEKSSFVLFRIIYVQKCAILNSKDNNNVILSRAVTNILTGIDCYLSIFLFFFLLY